MPATAPSPTPTPVWHPDDGSALPIAADNDALDLLGVRDSPAVYETAGGPTATVEQVRRGLPVTAVDHLSAALGVSLRALLEVVAIAPATLTRRRNGSARLSSAESDRVFRVADVFSGAISLFDGDRDAARDWLRQPAQALGGETPLRYLGTEVGAMAVRRLIGRLEYGVVV